MDIISYLLGKNSSGGGGGGTDLDEYFYTTIDENTSASETMSNKIIKKLADVIVDDSVTSLEYAYSSAKGIGGMLPKVICNNNITSLEGMYAWLKEVTSVDLSGLDTSNVTSMRMLFKLSTATTTLTSINFGNNFNTEKVTDMYEMFASNRGLTSLDLSSFKTPLLKNTSYMFNDCRGLTFLDIRNMTFDVVNSHSSMFSSSIPNNCLIIVKSDTEKTWITSKFSFLTNVKTAAEYEAE